jgi:hypothetical protein
MIERLREFCLRYHIHFNEEPQLLHASRHTWLISDVLGKQWVIKAKEPQDPTPELLKNFSVLHPPFHYPQPISEPDDPFMLCPYLQGGLLADDDFESPEIIEKVMDIIGRVQATMRSLVLVPFYQETMRLKDGDPLENPLGRMSFDRIQGTSEQQRAARHREMAESYRWTESTVQGCREALQAHRLWLEAPIEEYRDRVHNVFALHIPVVGSNLCHTALHPEHLVMSPDEGLGIVGWRIEPRPRFYMTYTYLAWSFLHSRKSDAGEFYRGYLTRSSSRAFHTEHHLVFALCLMEQLAHGCAQKNTEALPADTQRIDDAQQLFLECVEKTKKDDDGFA